MASRLASVMHRVSDMVVRPKSFLTLVRLAAIAASLTACGTASSYLTPSAATTTLMVGWEQHFTLEWTVEPEDSGRRLTGYVYNRHGEAAVRIRVLAQALDRSGVVIGQRIEWVPGGVGGFGRAYFIVPKLPIADTYRLTIWDYTWQQADGGDRH